MISNCNKVSLAYQLIEELPGIQLLSYTMRKTLENTIVVFLSTEQKKAILAQFWPMLTLLHLPSNRFEIQFRIDQVFCIL
jgi:hypothetical protein